LEVYDRHDRAVNVTMEPGDMVLYESGSLMHGRPFPLKGNYYANIFIHFEPTGEHLYDGDWEKVDDFYPPYIMPGTPEIDNWERRNPSGWKKQSPSAAVVPGLSEEHAAAAHGDTDSLREIAKENRRALHSKDKNGWQPIHEAVRGGHLDTVRYLVEQKADVNALTHFGKGVSPYYMALKSHGRDHPLTEYLNGLGAKLVGPEL
jgi:prolyl 4-hydroxylase